MDALLVKKAQKKDAAAFVQLIEEHKTALYRVARSYLSSEDDIADVIQDTILSAYEHMEELRTASYFKTWITRILINCCNALIRQQKKFIPIEQVQEPAALFRESDYEFFELLMELPEKDRVIFLLFYREGFSIREIAEVLEQNENTIKSKLLADTKKHAKHGFRRHSYAAAVIAAIFCLAVPGVVYAAANLDFLNGMFGNTARESTPSVIKEVDNQKGGTTSVRVPAHEYVSVDPEEAEKLIGGVTMLVGNQETNDAKGARFSDDALWVFDLSTTAGTPYAGNIFIDTKKAQRISSAATLICFPLNLWRTVNFRYWKFTTIRVSVPSCRMAPGPKQKLFQKEEPKIGVWKLSTRMEPAMSFMIRKTISRTAVTPLARLI